MNAMQLSEDYARIEQAIRYLDEHSVEQPSLQAMAASLNLSEYHFQRLFTRWVGVSPKRFLQYLTKEHAKRVLASSGDVLQAAYASGLSGGGRLYDLFVTYEAATPGEYKQRGAGLEIQYGFHPTPFGDCLLAITDRGICSLQFIRAGDQQSALMELRANWPKAELSPDSSAHASVTGQPLKHIFELLRGQAVSPLRLYLEGTNFQMKVWEALLRIPTGSLVSYEDLAVYIGLPTNARAVGNALGRNPIPVLIPCHRVIRKTGEAGDYRYGAARKKALLGWEAAYLERQNQDSRLMVHV